MGDPLRVLEQWAGELQGDFDARLGKLYRQWGVRRTLDAARVVSKLIDPGVPITPGAVWAVIPPYPGEPVVFSRLRSTILADAATAAARLEWGLAFQVAPAALDALRVVEADKVVGLDRAIREDIGSLVDQGMREGWSVPRLARKIRVAALEVTPKRALTIARTESVQVANTASLAQVRALNESARLAGERPVFRSKVWDAHHDERTRPTHQRADGQVVPIDGYFDVGGVQMQHPGDNHAPAREVVNCRCAMRFTDDPPPNALTKARDVGAAEPSREDIPAAPASSQARQAASTAEQIVRGASTLSHAYDQEALVAGTDATQSAAIDTLKRSTHPLADEKLHSRALSRYQGSGFREVNEGLRAGETHELVPLLDDVTASADGALGADTILYRSVTGVGADAKAGTVLSDAAYMSTSARVEKAARFLDRRDGAMLRIHARAGTRGFSFEGNGYSHTGEHEFLLKRDTRLMVTGRAGTLPNGAPVYDAVVLADDELAGVAL